MLNLDSVYGVGPVLAALSANKREFYVLYVQEGIDLSANNKRKKDKKGFEKVLKLAEKIGLTAKEIMQFLVLSAENGWRVIGGSFAPRALGLKKVTIGELTILVLGSEGTGLRPLVEISCAHLVKIHGNIPVHMSPGLEDAETEGLQSFLAVEILNVSVAAGVLLHHLVGTKNTKTVVDVQG